MAFRRRIQALSRRLSAALFPPERATPSAVLPGDAPGIDDGLDYAQPVLLPGHVRDVLEKSGRLQEWLSDRWDNPVLGSVNTVPVTEDPLQEWNWATRMQVLSTCHAAYQRNPVAKRAIFYLMAFTVGNGFNLTCKNEEVEAVLKAFIDNPDNAIREYERQAPIDLCVDGELFIRIFQEGGEIVAVPQRPWEVMYIHTEDGFFRRPLVYHIQPYGRHNTDDPAQPAPVAAYDVDAKEMMHVAINRMSYELRGRPELYAALPWLRAHKEWQENRAKQNYYRGALLWWVKIVSSVPAVIAAKLAQYQRPPTPGSTVVTSDKEEWSALTNPVGAGDASEDGRQLKLMALNGLGGIPEYMTGDGENANRATTQSQQLPVLMTFRMFQTILIEQVWIPLFKRVLQAKIDSGELPETVAEYASTGEPVMDEDGVGKTVNTLDAFSVEYEPPNDDEPHTLAQALQIAQTNGWISKQTARTEMGFDNAIEKERIAEEQEEDAEAMAQGKMPYPAGTIPPGMMDTDAAGGNAA